MHMRRNRTTSLLWIATVAAIGMFGASTVVASSGGSLLKARDDCETTSFNAAVGPGTCAGDGDTTFDEFVDDLLSEGVSPKWRFSATRVEVDRSRTLAVRNDGGEFHTFTKVAAFGGGCIPEVNALLGMTPVPECQPEVAPGVPLAFVTSGIARDQTLTLPALTKGTHRFECLIHPWMKTTVTVR
jgi:hypothetical protein